MKKEDQKSFIFVLFGATGDLALKKIFPAFLALREEGAFAVDSEIIAVSRRDWDDAEFVSFLKEKSGINDQEFLGRVSYAKVDIEAGTGYEALASKIGLKGAPKKEVVFYASLAPTLHGKAISALRDANLLYRAKKKAIGPKILIEKPFGTDQKSACELDRLIASFLDEDQVYRVDHYLGKDTVRAIMDLHESTPDFSNLLSTESVHSINIRLFEEKGIDGRGASYDGVGAFRDVGQNHMLEMLAVLAADLDEVEGVQGETALISDPSKKVWQAARAAVLERLQPPAKTCELSRRGQYEGYEKEAGVKAGSETETAFEVITNLRAGKLKGVPLVLQSGKKMLSSEVAIEVIFKDISGLPKRMLFKVQPEQEILIENRDGSTDEFEVARSRDAYGNVIKDAIAGCERCFAGREEIEALWSYADRVVACWNKVPLERYSPAKPFLVQ